MYKYKPSRSLYSKKQYARDKKDNKYFKTFNIDIENLTPDMIMHLQAKLGNNATEALLKEMGNLKLSGSGENEVQLKSAITKQYGNKTMLTRKQVNNFTRLADKNSMLAKESITKGDFAYKGNKDVGRIVLRYSEIDFYIRKMCELKNILKTKQNKDALKMEEIKDADRLLTDNKKIKKREIDLIIDMIDKLPSYGSDKSIQEQYIKVLNFLVSSGVNLRRFFELNGDIIRQKNLVFKAISKR